MKVSLFVGVCFGLLYRIYKQRFLAKTPTLKTVMSIHVLEIRGEIVLVHLLFKQGGRVLLGWPRWSPVPALSDE